ncbi:hypothetical protein NPIL_649291 [Nephila pilipes]|uniref:Uncharacterized protein n=1 Tax=Nephila pilipes TaxID=299642 RepID=A0A8X6NB89_NEPPI|nr:hypothetical protein NPIL_657581 [Nephila pilipes]GFT76899.1 hypothetical protein NPIL_649291 [Nephila pilipes]
MMSSKPILPKTVECVHGGGCTLYLERLLRVCGELDADSVADLIIRPWFKKDEAVDRRGELSARNKQSFYDSGVHRHSPCLTTHPRTLLLIYPRVSFYAKNLLRAALVIRNAEEWALSAQFLPSNESCWEVSEFQKSSGRFHFPVPLFCTERSARGVKKSTLLPSS